MRISFTCPNGHKLAAKEQLAGRRIKCPKCSAVVAIPAAPSVGGDEGPSFLDTSPAPSFDAPSFVPANRFPSQPAAVPVAPETTSWRGKRSLPLIIAGAVSVLGVLLLGTVAIVWLTLGGQRSGATGNSPNTTPTPLAEVSSADEPAASAKELQPGELTRIELDPRLHGYKLAGPTWAAAYDEITGRLAVTNDQQGILIYEIEALLKGDLKPTAILATAGLPTAICLKPLAERRLFVIASQDKPQLQLVDADSLQNVNNVPLENLDHVKFLASSSNPTDPFVYYSTQKQSATDQSGDNVDGYLTAERLGRVNLVTGKQDGHTQQAFGDVTVSAAGQHIYARPTTSADGVTATWEELLSYRAGHNSPLAHWKRSLAISPLWRLRDSVAVAQSIYDPSIRVYAGTSDFFPTVAFHDRPLLLGVSEAGLVFGSANDYRSLVSIPLPGPWMRTNRIRDEPEFRMRLGASPILQSRFFDMKADDSRALGILVLDEHLVVARVDQAAIPSEPSLIVAASFPEKVTVGQPVRLELAAGAENVTFEFVASVEGLRQQQVRLLGAKPGEAVATAPAASSGIQLVLAAAVNAQQSVIILNDIRPLKGETLPLTIQVGDERMKVIRIDDFKQFLYVYRTEPVDHKVVSEVWVIDESSPQPDPTSGLPVIEGNSFTWTPTKEQVGMQVLRMRARSGEVTHDWYWETEVTQEQPDLPFQVAGIEPLRGTDLAIVWGQDALPHQGRTSSQTNDTPTGYLGIYNVVQKRLLRHVEVQSQIHAAAIDPTGVYALTSIAETNSAPATVDRRQSEARQVVRLDPETLTITQRAAAPSHSGRLQLVAGRYLAVFAHSAVTRFNTPDLTRVEPELGVCPYPIAGRLRNGWVWDGIVWDEQMIEPKLLLFPVLFQHRVNSHAKPEMIAADGKIAIKTSGSRTAMWLAPKNQLSGRYPLLDFPAGLSAVGDRVEAYSWAATSLPYVGDGPKPTTVQLFDINTVWKPQWGQPAARELNGYVAVSDGQVYVASLGRLYTVPLDQLVQPEETFQFVEEQEQFVLPIDEPATLRYSAPGAVRYQFQLWLQRPFFGDEEPDVVAESTDGTFQLMLDKVAGSAGQRFANEAIRSGRLAPQDISEKLAKRKPNGALMPVYVSVVAEHADGRQKAGLAHSYLIEIVAAGTEQGTEKE